MHINSQIGSSLDVTCLFTPCHTTGHICYFIKHSSKDDVTPIVLTGDTLFIAGCGRFFEGNAEQMHNNLLNILATLPADTVSIVYFFQVSCYMKNGLRDN